MSKVKKPKIIETRRHKALRRTLIMLALVAVVQMIGGIGLTPGHARYLNEQSHHTGRTKVVASQYDFRFWKWEPWVLQLAENKYATVFSRGTLSFFGWLDGGAACIDCTDPAPLYAAFYSITYGESDNSYYIFGRIDDPSITTLTIDLQNVTDYTPDGKEIPGTVASKTCDRADWLEKDGRFYFLMDCSDFPRSKEFATRVPVTGYDENGNVVFTAESSKSGTWTSAG